MNAINHANTHLLLGWFELVSVPLAIGLLLAAVLGARPRSLGARILFAVVIGLTVAQPFGVTATRISVDQYARDRIARVSTTGWHTMSVGSLPIAFHVYQHDKFGLADSSPRETIRARSWLGPLTNATA